MPAPQPGLAPMAAESPHMPAQKNGYGHKIQSSTMPGTGTAALERTAGKRMLISVWMPMLHNAWYLKHSKYISVVKQTITPILLCTLCHLS